MNVSDFKKLIKPVTDFVSSSKIDAELGEELNRRFPPGAETFDAIEKACHAAVEAGWMCANGEEGGPRWGRVIEPGPETGRCRLPWESRQLLKIGRRSNSIREWPAAVRQTIR